MVETLLDIAFSRAQKHSRALMEEVIHGLPEESHEALEQTVETKRKKRDIGPTQDASKRDTA